MLKIRLTRTGKRGQAMYRIVVAESSKSQFSKTVDILGWYNPAAEGKDRYSIDMAKYQEWVQKGAQPNDSVLRLVLSKKEKEERWPDPKKANASEKKAESKPEEKTEEPKEEVKSDESAKEESKKEESKKDDSKAEEKSEVKKD